MIDGLKSWWSEVGDGDGAVAPPDSIDFERLKNPFSTLPNALELTALQQSWLERDLSRTQSMLTMMAYQRAASIRGPEPKYHQKRRERLAQLQSKAHKLGFQLPEEFVIFLENDEYVNRLRFGCHWIQLADFICPCPLDNRYIMILFLCEAQGCNYTHTHVLLELDGSHCITRTGHWYGHRPYLPPGVGFSNVDEPIFHYADSFAEFICWASDEIRRTEIYNANCHMKLADGARDSGDFDGAFAMYQLALSYNPASKELLDRIAQLETTG